MSAPMPRDELSRLIAKLLTMTNDRRARLPDSSVRSMHGNILRQLEFMQSVLDDGRTPSIEEKNSLDLGVIAARELEQVDFDYADQIMLAVYNFSKL